ncbi:hypothetical protein PBNK5_16400 [Pectobacterium brasiliense]
MKRHYDKEENGDPRTKTVKFSQSDGQMQLSALWVRIFCIPVTEAAAYAIFSDLRPAFVVLDQSRVNEA